MFCCTLHFCLPNLLNVCLLIRFMSWRTAHSPFMHLLDTTRLDYLVFGNSKLCYFSELTCPPKSQYFRRVVAHLVGHPRHWHYAQYPYELNSLLTARTWFTPLP